MKIPFISVGVIGIIAEILLGSVVFIPGMLLFVVGAWGALTESEPKFKAVGVGMAIVGTPLVVLGLFALLCALSLFQRRATLNF